MRFSVQTWILSHAQKVRWPCEIIRWTPWTGFCAIAVGAHGNSSSLLPLASFDNLSTVIIQGIALFQCEKLGYQHRKDCAHDHSLRGHYLYDKPLDLAPSQAVPGVINLMAFCPVLPLPPYR
jgi:hypothetical protein